MLRQEDEHQAQAQGNSQTEVTVRNYRLTTGIYNMIVTRHGAEPVCRQCRKGFKIGAEVVARGNTNRFSNTFYYCPDCARRLYIL